MTISNSLATSAAASYSSLAGAINAQGSSASTQTPEALPPSIAAASNPFGNTQSGDIAVNRPDWARPRDATPPPQDNYHIKMGNNNGPIDMSGNGQTGLQARSLNIFQKGPFDAHFGKDAHVEVDGNRTTVSGNGSFDVQFGGSTNKEYSGNGRYSFTFIESTAPSIGSMAPTREAPEVVNPRLHGA